MAFSEYMNFKTCGESFQQVDYGWSPSDNEPSGLLIDMGKFVKSSIDKGVQTIKNLVKPQSETYDAPPPVKTYSLGK